MVKVTVFSSRTSEIHSCQPVSADQNIFSDALFCKILKAFGLISKTPVVKNIFVTMHERIHHVSDGYFIDHSQKDCLT